VCKSFFLSLLYCLLIFVNASSQSSTTSVASSGYHPASVDKISWQRLNLLLSSTYFQVVKEGQINLDSALIYASRSLGLSRSSVLAEGIDDSELLSQLHWIDQRDPAKGVEMLSAVKGKKHLETLILLGAYYAFEPKGYIHYKDSVEYLLKSAIEESKNLKDQKLGRRAVCLLIKTSIQSNETLHTDSILRKLIENCETAGDKETAARAFLYRGLYAPFSMASTQNRIEYFEKAGNIFRELKNTEGEINTLTDIGYLLLTTGQQQRAYNAFASALQKAESIHYPYIHYITDALALVTTSQGKFGEPLKYSLQSIKTAEDNRDSIGWAYFYYRLAHLYREEEAQENEYWTRKALDRFVMEHNPALYNILTDVIDIMIEEGHSREALDLTNNIAKKIPPVNLTERFFYHLVLSICYKNLGQFKSAESHLLQADSLETKAEAFRGPLRRGTVYAQYGYLYLAQRQYLKAKESFEKYFKSWSFGSQSMANYIRSYRKLIEIDSTLDDKSAALVHYKRYVQLLDSNFQRSKIRQAEELQVKYQSEEKENKIALLNQQTKLEQANLKEATLIKNVTIAAIGAMIVIAGLLYRQTRMRKKNNNRLRNVLNEKERVLDEKEWLLKEIHHRVKNNLQIVMSLLNSQSAFIDNQAALTAIHDSQHRVHAMSLIHQKLYNTENVSSIDMSFYIRELSSYLNESFNTQRNIRFHFDLESLEIDVSQAVPLGLILNEAITNALKYAFPERENGSISISLKKLDEHQCLLAISDNGIGMPSRNKKTGSLGMSLMEGLSEDLGGKFTIENNHGTMVRILFIHDAVTKRSIESVAVI